MERKYKFDMYRRHRPVDFITTLYLVYISGFYPVFMTNFYFNITITKARAFMYGTLAFMFLAVFAWVIELILISYYTKNDIFDFYIDSKVVTMPELWMILFLIANIFAWVMAEDKSSALTGEDARRFGLGMIMVITFMFIIISRQVCVEKPVYIVIIIVSCFTYVVAILQHAGYNPLGLRTDLSDRQKNLFVSTFGNLNVFGSYVCISLAIMLAVFIFSNSRFIKCLSVSGIITGACSVITTESDNVYLGIIVACIILFYMSAINKRIDRWFIALLLVFAGLFIMSVINEICHGDTRHLNGIAEIIGNKYFMGFFFLVFLTLSVIVCLLKNRKRFVFEMIQCKKSLIIISTLGLIIVISVFIMGIRTQNPLFVFDDEWGTYRGYIWKRSWKLFCDAPLLNKLFGYGNESLGILMNGSYREEMLAITNRTYDNAHNELLQYLVTTGLMGMISYLGLFISGITYMLKRAKEDPVVIACATGCVAYFIQGMVNVNQPITTPFYFVIMAVGIGYVRYRDRHYGVYKEVKE